MGAISFRIAAIFLLASTSPAPPLPFQKGVNLTAEWPGGYSPEAVRPMLAKLKQAGVNAVALVPYGVSPSGKPSIRWSGGMERDDWIALATADAHKAGMRVLLKPQLWVPKGDTASIDFTAPADLDQWFAEYAKFISHEAREAAAAKADLFCVGVEFGKLSRYEARWRAVIAGVRKIYSGPLVYAASQGPEFEQLRFWDAVDYVGLNNYYPLPDDLSTDRLVKTVESVQRRAAKPVIFTEIGFSSFKAPQRQPWDETPRELAPDDQARCYQALLAAFYTKPWVAGFYWGKVGTNGYGGPKDGSHTPWGKPAMEVVEKWYLGRAR
jgi:hypothetical protein